MFCELRNKAKCIIKKERRKYFVRMCSKSDCSMIWKILKNAGCGHSNDLIFDGDVDYINEYFAKGVEITDGLDIHIDFSSFNFTSLRH